MSQIGKDIRDTLILDYTTFSHTCSKKEISVFIGDVVQHRSERGAVFPLLSAYPMQLSSTVSLLQLIRCSEGKSLHFTLSTAMSLKSPRFLFYVCL